MKAHDQQLYRHREWTIKTIVQYGVLKYKLFGQNHPFTRQAMSETRISFITK